MIRASSYSRPRSASNLASATSRKRLLGGGPKAGLRRVDWPGPDHARPRRARTDAPFEALNANRKTLTARANKKTWRFSTFRFPRQRMCTNSRWSAGVAPRTSDSLFQASRFRRRPKNAPANLQAGAWNAFPNSAVLDDVFAVFQALASAAIDQASDNDADGADGYCPKHPMPREGTDDRADNTSADTAPAHKRSAIV